MSKPIPLKSNTGDSPVLLINPDASLVDLQASASLRLNAARNLLQTLSCTTLLHADEGDLGRVTQALYLLLDDGCDVLQAAQCKALGEGAVV
ncbi:hypothetical protein F2A38_28965 [Pseudomonas chlororaphis]|jgi:hypothetical protein|uniref:Short-chain dehydrogenase n=1 Tax=Pseudomonas chlororaphis TaxID=587753 RepID=A0AB34BYD5_9PSED|nr:MULTISPECIES: hypothetical protein [Pseudomonas]KAA5836504.1 hypothetical protein F2A38_28965 [Pseudomonas chlororaphis]MCP1481876.1 hypothetical protein [Pseudomonas chlororaphis]MCP1597765.1 hypothetical protein [Pseudomonas chlororaphis]SDY61790.1 hypothetical protein SAMN03159453_00955 [Pseudomonas sp. NFIX28]